MATVSDLPYMSDGEYGYYRFNAAIKSAYDYYPFGSLKPGRYTSDTSSNCVTLTQNKWVTKYRTDSVWVNHTLVVRQAPSLLNVNTIANEVVATANDQGSRITFTGVAGANAIAQAVIPTTVSAAVVQELSLSTVTYDSNMVLSITEEVNGKEIVLHTGVLAPLMSDAGAQLSTISILPQTSNVKVKIGPAYILTPGTAVVVDGYWKKVTTPYQEQEQILVTLCDSVGDQYRFGFNGQEKVNEIAGVGNHNTAEFWEYDTRLGRRWNLDPVDQVSISNYAVNGNSPILMNDPNGDVTGDYYTTEGKHLGKDEKSDNKVYSTSQGNYDYMTGVTSNSKPDYDGLRESSNLLKDDKGNNLGHDKFLNMAATVFGESTAYKTNGATDNLKKEMGGIAYVHKNNKLAFAASDGNDQVALFKNTQLAKQTPKMQLANWSIINAYTNGYDYSNGAHMWDGAEQAIFPSSNNERSVKYGKRSFELHMNTMGWNISDEHYKIWKNNVGSSFQAPQKKAAPDNFGNYKNKGKMILKSTAVYGQTIFWKDTSK